jgi:hypothetical protein
MEFRLVFGRGELRGEGRDRVGEFVLSGSYTLRDGMCSWLKRYVGKHDVFYKGYNEGRGIWGVWEIPPLSRGGFHIWPMGMADPTVQAQQDAVEEALPRLTPALRR